MIWGRNDRNCPHVSLSSLVEQECNCIAIFHDSKLGNIIRTLPVTVFISRTSLQQPRCPIKSLLDPFLKSLAWRRPPRNYASHLSSFVFRNEFTDLQEFHYFDINILEQRLRGSPQKRHNSSYVLHWFHDVWVRSWILQQRKILITFRARKESALLPELFSSADSAGTGDHLPPCQGSDRSAGLII